MDRKRAKEIIKAIAKKEGKDEKLIREEMKEVINTGYMNAGKQEIWVDLFGANHIPDPEEFIMRISRRVKGEYEVRRMIF